VPQILACHAKSVRNSSEKTATIHGGLINVAGGGCRYAVSSPTPVGYGTVDSNGVMRARTSRTLWAGEGQGTPFGCRSHCRYRVAAFSAIEPMFVIAEPESCYAERLRTPRPVPSIVAAAPTTPPKPIVPGHLPSDDFWTVVVFEILKTSGGEPMRITSIVNESLKWEKFARRADRVEHKKKMFRVVGRLIRTCRLDRYNREFVTVPTSDVRRQVYLAKAALTVELPSPCV
jgi:hypothetical protein